MPIARSYRYCSSCQHNIHSTTRTTCPSLSSGYAHSRSLYAVRVGSAGYNLPLSFTVKSVSNGDFHIPLASSYTVLATNDTHSCFEFYQQFLDGAGELFELVHSEFVRCNVEAMISCDDANEIAVREIVECEIVLTEF